MPDNTFTFEIKEHLGVITRYESGWRKELNLVSWNGGAPKYDIRDWDPYHERMSRGLTFHAAEMRKLADLYISSNNRKAVQEGEQLEAQRRERRSAYRRKRAEERQDPALEAAEQDAYEGAVPPAPEQPEGCDLSEAEGGADRTIGAEERAPASGESAGITGSGGNAGEESALSEPEDRNVPF